VARARADRACPGRTGDGGDAGSRLFRTEPGCYPPISALSNDSLDGRQIKVATENDRYRGGAGNDLVAGSKGTDTALLGSGDDTFRWDNGEGSDVVEGDDGYDTLVFDGAGISEQATLSANDGRLSFFRTQGNVLMDRDGVERVDDSAARGADSVTVDDLPSTDVRQTNLDLGGTDGG
jgi:Ca2+-binding RTX toxin-like protein